MTFTKTIQTPDVLREKVASLIQEVTSTHRYSMSRIYGLYNEVFSVAEVPQSCASCLIRKVNQLKSWLVDQPVDEPDITGKVSQQGRKLNRSSK